MKMSLDYLSDGQLNYQRVSRWGHQIGVFESQVFDKTSSVTFSARDILTLGFIIRNAGSSTVTDVLPSASAIISGIGSNARLNNGILLLIANYGSGIVTLSPGSGITFKTSAKIGPGCLVRLLFLITDVNTIICYSDSVSDTLITDTINCTTLTATNGTITTLGSTNGTITNVTSTTGVIGVLSGSTAGFTTVNTSTINVDTFSPKTVNASMVFRPNGTTDGMFKLVGNSGSTMTACSIRINGNNAEQGEFAITPGTGNYVSNGGGTTVVSGDFVMDHRNSSNQLHFAIGTAGAPQVPIVTYSNTEPKARVNNQLKVYDTTESSSSTTGSIVTAGGVGIAKALTVAGDVTCATDKTDYTRFLGLRHCNTSGTFVGERGGDGSWYLRSPSGTTSTTYANFDLSPICRQAASKGFKLASVSLSYQIANATVTTLDGNFVNINYTDGATITPSVSSAKNYTKTVTTAGQVRTENHTVTSPAFQLIASYHMCYEVTLTPTVTSDTIIRGLTCFFTMNNL